MKSFKQDYIAHSDYLRITASLLGAEFSYPSIYLRSEALGGVMRIYAYQDATRDLAFTCFKFDGCDHIFSVAGRRPTKLSKAGKKYVPDLSVIDPKFMLRVAAGERPPTTAQRIREEFIPAMEAEHGVDLRKKLEQHMMRTNTEQYVNAILSAIGMVRNGRYYSMPGHALNATASAADNTVEFVFSVKASELANVLPGLAELIPLLEKKS